MSFAGLAFIFHFLPAFLIAYYLTPVKHRRLTLLAGSLAFYGIGSPLYLCLLIGSVLINYGISVRIHHLAKKKATKSAKSSTIHRKRAWLIVAIIYNIGILFTFKYYDTVAAGINKILGSIDGADSQLGAASGVGGWQLPELGLLLPLGISFYTFQMLSFIFDVYSRKIKGRVSLYHFAVYATMFPQIGAGPIVRFVDINQDIYRPSPVKGHTLERGMMFFAVGLSYKVLLADKLASLWTDVWRVGVSGIDVASAWLGAWGYSLQILFDFSGYSLMAIGVGLMLGFGLPENFNEPYSAKTMTDFWRRWHITLGKWFRDYIYIPMGGSRRGRGRMILAMFVVWMTTGLWHGASLNFIIWGLFLFVTMLVEKLLTNKWLEGSRVLGHIYMFILIPVSWMIFNITDVGILGEYLLRMVGGLVDTASADSLLMSTVTFGVAGMNGFELFLELIGNYWWLLVLGAFFATPLPRKFFLKYEKTIWVKAPLFLLFWLSVYELAVSSNNPFIYFGF